MRFIVVAVIVALSLPASPLVLTGAAQSQLASINGTATSSTGDTLANATLQLRDLATGRVASTTTSSSTGSFSFAGLPPGTYAVEILNATGQVVATSASLLVGAAAAITGVAVSTAVAGVAAAGTASFASVTTIVAVTSAAAAAGVLGVVSRGGGRSDASPSR